MTDFANLRDGGRRLGPLLAAALDGVDRAVLLAVVPNGIPVALGIREALPASLATELRALAAERSESGVVIAADPSLAGRTVVVVDDGVETGTVARAAARALAESDVARVMLAVPVCPHEAAADLRARYDQIVAVARPFVRRDLAWHFADFDTIDEERALVLLAQSPGAEGVADPA